MLAFVLALMVNTLQVPRFGDAVVVAPSESPTSRVRPVLIVLHGNGDRAESICPAFHALTGGRAFILCPRGVPIRGTDGFTFVEDARAVEAEVRAALAALRREYGWRVASGPVVLAGFSLGAMYAALLARADPATFARAFVVDTHHVFRAAERRRYEANGGRVRFACSRTYVADCQRLCGKSDGGCVLLPDREHGYDEELFTRTRDAFEALIADDASWR
jgi:pimeloyl-ACP methyl ester carboxylesterase